MLSAVKTAEREMARELRADGRAVTEIAGTLRVSKSSVSLWVRDIPLSDAQRDALMRRSIRYEGQWKGAATNIARGRARRLTYQEAGRKRVVAASPDYIGGCMLFWAEGDKARNHVGVANSDPELLACFVEFLRNHFNVENEKMRIACNLFADHVERIVEVEDFWLKTLGLTRANLRKSMVNKYSKHSQKKRKNRLPYGTCKLVVHSTEIVQTIYGSIQEYAGFTRDEWLD
jgi:hypothetical protein